MPDGHLAPVIGDVTGHDLRAAVRMSRLRGVACDRQAPGRILRRLDPAQQPLHTRAPATCTYAVLEPGGPSCSTPTA
ncbi:SpoIIE family protein phosphatase [Streptomyces sp. NPDC057217]|uniref:SpoIIE family protein phosphatase n=1 Tax=Streptomyces sp. NPDC057217 TaxID=3346054 RepID=UPI003643845B